LAVPANRSSPVVLARDQCCLAAVVHRAAGSGGAACRSAGTGHSFHSSEFHRPVWRLSLGSVQTL